MEDEFFEGGSKIVDWTIIKNYMEEGTVSGLLMALMESDKLLNFMLSDMGYPGPTIYLKIKSAKERFTNLPGLMEALETKEKVFTRYEEKVSTRDVNMAIKEYKQAIIDLSSNSDASPPGLWEKMKAYIEYNFVSKPRNLFKLVIYFLLLFVFIFVLDNTHFGQVVIHGTATYLAKFISWIVISALIILAVFVVVVSLIVFMERRNRD